MVSSSLKSTAAKAVAGWRRSNRVYPQGAGQDHFYASHWLKAHIAVHLKIDNIKLVSNLYIPALFLPEIQRGGISLNTV
jgi:hypothetical protein